MIRERIVNNYMAIQCIRILRIFNETTSFNGEIASGFSSFRNDDKFEIIK
jgi:hypothetical protein